MPRILARGAVALTAVLLVYVANPAASQTGRIDALSLQSGARARILGPTTDSKYTHITIASISQDSLRYMPLRSLDTKSLSWQQINKMDVSIGTHRHFGRGLGIGLLVGAVGGALLGASARARDTKGAAAIGAGVLGFLGGISGAVVGLAWRTENWIPVNLPRSSAPGTDARLDDTRRQR
jgi:hypothetical protein